MASDIEPEGGAAESPAQVKGEPAQRAKDSEQGPLPPQLLVEGYLEYVRVEKRLAQRTVELYAEDLRKLHHYAEGIPVDLTAVRSAHIRRWMAHMHGAGRSPRGIALILSGWRGFYTWLGRQGLVTSNPVSDVRAPKAAKPLPKALGVDEAVQLASFKNSSSNSIVDGGYTPISFNDPVNSGDDEAAFLNVRDCAMVELMYSSGLRVGELIGLDAQASAQGNDQGHGWVDLEAGEAHVCGKGRKWRSVPVGRHAVAALQAWVQAREAWFAHGDKTRDKAPVGEALFLGRNGTRLTAQSVWQRLRSRSLQAGLATPVHPHMLRHSFASHILQSSGDLRAVQELLGHANISTTQVYTRLDFQHLAKVYDAAHPRAKLKKGPKPGGG